MAPWRVPGPIFVLNITPIRWPVAMLLAVPEGLRRASLWAVYVSETYDTGGKPTKTDLRRSDRPPSEASRPAAAG